MFMSRIKIKEEQQTNTQSSKKNTHKMLFKVQTKRTPKK